MIYTVEKPASSAKVRDPWS